MGVRPVMDALTFSGGMYQVFLGFMALFAAALPLLVWWSDRR
jgi:hypothetical protein